MPEEFEGADAMPNKPRIPYLIARIAREQDRVLSAQTQAALEAVLAHFEDNQEKVRRLLIEIFKSSAVLEKINACVVAGDLHQAEQILHRFLSDNPETLAKLTVGVDVWIPHED
jgi:hypothetical protein